MTLGICHHQPGVRLGVDQCPGIGERGHGLTMATIHDAGCCQEWESGQAVTPARAESANKTPAGGGAPWPGERQPPARGAEHQQATAGTEPEAGQ
jgi:hypothetical protein